MGTATAEAPPKAEMGQRQAALAHALRTKARRSALRREVESRRQISHVLESEIPPYIAGMILWDFLRWVPRLGPERVEAALRQAKLSPARKLGRLTERQRLCLAAVLKTRGR